MVRFNPMLLIDFYKATHPRQYPKGLTKLVAYYVPRGYRIEGWDMIPLFGLQGFIKDYLIDGFNEYFFNRPKQEVINEYREVMDVSLGEDAYDIDLIANLHDLGYLPLEIWAVPEGTRTKAGVPQIQITNTHDGFPWLVNTIESLLSCTLWHAQIAAEVGYRYRELVNEFAFTCDDTVALNRIMGDFSMRGQHSAESAIYSSAGWLLSHLNTATVPAILWAKKNYGPADNEGVFPIGYGAISTEHSCMTSNYAVDGDEITHIKRLLTETYPNSSFSMVSDSYDYDNLIDNILPQVRVEIEGHNGCLGIRGDSGNPVRVVVDTVIKLWDKVGGTHNKVGYKVLNSKYKVIYGDSITLQVAKEIFTELANKGFAISNVTLGMGSFSMMCYQDSKGNLNPFTRDTFNTAVKTTYGECGPDKPLFIFKDPKGASFKKSHRGCCYVYPPSQEVVDELEYRGVKIMQDYNLLRPVMIDGKLIIEESLQVIRQRMHNENFNQMGGI